MLQDKQKILYVDWRNTICEVFKSYFKTAYDVFTAIDKVQTGEILRNKNVDLVIVNTISTGGEVLEELREANPGVTFIALVRYDKGNVVQMKAGEEFILVKSSEDYLRLEKLIENVLESSELSAVYNHADNHFLEGVEKNARAFIPTDQPVSVLEVAPKPSRISARERIEGDKIFREIFELSGNGIAIVDTEGNFVRTNESFRKMLGYTRDDLKTMKMSDIVHADKLRESRMKIKQLLDGESRNYESEKPFIKKSGDTIIGSTSVTALHDENGEVSLLSVLISDITEQKLIEKQLIESESELRILAESAPIHILKIDKEYSITFINNAFGGQRRSQLFGTNLFNWIPKKEAVKVRSTIEKVFETGESGQCEVLMSNGDGSKAWFSTIVGPIVKDGCVDTVMLLANNITNEKEAIEMKERFTRKLEIKVSERTAELQSAKLKLAMSLEKEQELGELKSRFVATASHQFRTPLTVIQSNMGVLAMQMDDMNEEFVPKFEKSYNRIKHQINRMTSLMDDVLILGKINTGNILHKLVPTDLIELCEEVANNHNEILKNGRSVQFSYTGEPVPVLLYKKLMEHAISNLLSNALKYSPSDTEPSMCVIYEADKVSIRIKDKGIGIPKEDLNHLFEPFYRASNVGEISGTGLGSTIVKEYVGLNNGTITVNSELKKGSEFTIEFNADGIAKNQVL